MNCVQVMIMKELIISVKPLNLKPQSHQQCQTNCMREVVTSDMVLIQRIQCVLIYLIQQSRNKSETNLETGQFRCSTSQHPPFLSFCLLLSFNFSCVLCLLVQRQILCLQNCLVNKFNVCCYVFRDLILPALTLGQVRTETKKMAMKRRRRTIIPPKTGQKKKITCSSKCAVLAFASSWLTCCHYCIQCCGGRRSRSCR